MNGCRVTGAGAGGSIDKNNKRAARTHTALGRQGLKMPWLAALANRRRPYEIELSKPWCTQRTHTHTWTVTLTRLNKFRHLYINDVPVSPCVCPSVLRICECEMQPALIVSKVRAQPMRIQSSISCFQSTYGGHVRCYFYILIESK